MLGGAGKGLRRGGGGGSLCDSERKRRRFERIDRGKYISSENTIEKGDRVDLSQLLFTQQRDYLIKSNHPELKVQAKHLEGKLIVLHFVPLLPELTLDIRLSHINSLIDIYNDIQPKFGFEVIFVPVSRRFFVEKLLNSTLHTRFEKLFSLMPWTAIPLSDVKTRKDLATIFPVYQYMTHRTTVPVSFVIDPTGLVLQCPIKDEYLFEYGSQGFPFSNERFKCLITEDNEAKKHPSITKLLTSPERNYVINKANKVVPVDSLENKVVAFYFYEDGIGMERSFDGLTQKIKVLYTQLADKGNFEVVLVYIHDSPDAFEVVNEDSYHKTYDTMPWLALPFKDPRCKKLKRIVDYPIDLVDPPDPRLVIFDPQKKVLEPYAISILSRFRCDISAYPFTRQRAVEIETEFLRKQKLDMLFDPDSTFTRKDGTKINFSQLVGKNIILVIGNACDEYRKLRKVLTKKYFQMRGTIDEFEVIRIPNDPDFSAAVKPWLRQHHDQHQHQSKESEIPLLCHPAFNSKYSDTSNMFARLFGDRLVAFDRDGNVVSRTIFPSIESRNMKFPFYSGGLEKDVLDELICVYSLEGWTV